MGNGGFDDVVLSIVLLMPLVLTTRRGLNAINVVGVPFKSNELCAALGTCRSSFQFVFQ